MRDGGHHSGRDNPVYAAEDDYRQLMDYADNRGERQVFAFGSYWPVVPERRFETLQQMDDFVQIAKSDAMRRWPFSKAKIVQPVHVEWRGRNYDFCYYEGGVIYVPDLVGQKTDWRLMHELAHHGDSRTSHGRDFVRAYLTITSAVHGELAARLFAMFLMEKGVDPRWAAPA